jgi:NAD(P)-dependent dehydrogenase (short-subunit alcohol dehydrogenase family)
MSPTSLAGLAVAITGGGHGIGQATAVQFARAGARVAIGDLDDEAAETVADSLGGQASGHALDVSDRDSFAAFLDAAAERHGPLDVLVNNAGIDWMGPFHEEADEVTRRELDVNLWGTIIGSRLALQRMLPRGSGHLVNVASGAGRVPLPSSASYSATKHGVVGLTESLRLEYRDSGVRFSLIQPAQVKTAMLEGQVLPRLLPVVTADDVAAAILDAVRNDRFEVWVPRSQGATSKLGGLLPRGARERLLLALGVGRIAGSADADARREYHERAFGGGGRLDDTR